MRSKRIWGYFKRGHAEQASYYNAGNLPHIERASKYEFDGDKVVKVLSNPRRYSYALGFGTKTKTAYQFLIGKGKVNSLDELIDRFSVEVVNKQFYNEIALSFTKLVGGEREGRHYEKELNLYGVTSHNKYAEFAVRLIGRIIGS